MRILSNKNNLNIANARYRGYSRDSEYIGYRHTISTRKAIWYHSVSSNEQVHFILVLTYKYFLPSQWAAVLAPTYPLPVLSEYLITLRQSVAQNLSHMSRSTIEIGAVQFLFVKADLVRYDFCLRLSCVTSILHDFRPSTGALFTLTTSTCVVRMSFVNLQGRLGQSWVKITQG